MVFRVVHVTFFFLCFLLCSLQFALFGFVRSETIFLCLGGTYVFCSLASLRSSLLSEDSKLYHQYHPRQIYICISFLIVVFYISSYSLKF